MEVVVICMLSFRFVSRALSGNARLAEAALAIWG
jgi:hypothetical protein